MGAKFYKYFHHGATLLRNFENSILRQNRKATLETRMRTNHRNPNDISEDSSSMTSLDESFPLDDPLLFRGNWNLKNILNIRKNLI